MNTLKYLAAVIITSAVLVSCKDKANCHDTHSEGHNSHIEHKHDHKGHNHDHSGHDHKGHNHDHSGHAFSGAKRSPLYNEIMAIHDEAMPWMGDIHQTMKKLKNITPSDDTHKIKIEKAIKDLDDASEGMMEWMDAFKNTSTDQDYLKGELPKVKEVRANMEKALKNGKHQLNPTR